MKKDKSLSLLKEVGKLLTGPNLSDTQKTYSMEENFDSVVSLSSTFLTKQTVFGRNNLIENSNIWVSKTNLPDEFSYASAFHLTNDLSMVCGGSSCNDYPYSMIPLNNTYRFSGSANSWTSRLKLPRFLYATSSTHLTDDYGILCGGCNLSTYYSYNYRYTNSTDAWSSRTAISIGSIAYHITSYLRTHTKAIVSNGNFSTGMQNHSAVYEDPANTWTAKGDTNYNHSWSGFSLANRRSVSLGNNTAEKYDDIYDVWTVISGINEGVGEGRYAIGSFGVDTGSGIIAGGIYNGSVVTGRSEKYVESTNTWRINSSLLAVTSYSANFQVEGNGNGIIAGGNNGSYGFPTHLASVSKYYDGAFYRGRHYITSYDYISSDLMDRGEDKLLTSTTLFTRDYRINNVLVSSSFSNLRSVSIYDISIDDGITWKCGFKVGTIADTIGLHPSSDGTSKLKIRLIVNGDLYADNWTYRADTPYLMSSGIGFSFSSDFAIYNGGRNTSTTAHKESYSYTYSLNVWGTRADAIKATYRQGGFTLSNFGIMMGGYNYSDYLDLVQKYSRPANAWASLSSTIEKRHEFTGAPLTSDIGMYWGGRNGSAYLSSNGACYNSSETLSLRTSLLSARCEHCGGWLNSDLIISATGVNSSGNSTNIVDRYSYSGNTWVARTYILYSKNDAGCLSFPSDLILVSGGHNGSIDGVIQNTLYSDSRNMWTIKCDLPENRQHTGDFSLTSSIGILAAGIVNTDGYTDTALQYNLGNTNIYGFNVTDFNGEKICL